MLRSKRWLRWLGIVLVMALLATFANATVSAADDYWHGVYFNNKNLGGDPVFARDDLSINFNWGQGSPASDVNVNQFSARWTRNLSLSAGRYWFTVTADDGVRLWVNNQLLIDQWHDGTATTYNADINLPAGDIPVKLEYYEGYGEASVQLSWTASGGGSANTWYGEYFNNRNLSGGPTTVRDDANIDFNWGNGSPTTGIGNDNFSVRWTRTLNLSGGRYRFSATVDDGVRLWVNNQLLIDQWHDQPVWTYNAEIDLGTGAVPVRMEYYDSTGGAVARLSWTKVSEPAPSISNWRGEYFNNKDLAGNPSLVRDDGSINFNWGNGAPAGGINADNFSVRWTRSINVTNGRYRFTTTTDDGVRLWVNNQLVIDKWMNQTATSYSAEMDLGAGSVPVRMEYFENGGLAMANLSWTQVSSTPPPPSSNGTAIVIAYRLNVRSGPSTDYGIITKINLGTVVQLLGRNQAATWVYVSLPGGTQGWVSASYLQSSTNFSTLPLWTGTPPPTGTGGAPTATVTAYYLNVRGGPGVNYNILTAIPRNMVVTVTHRNASATWVRIVLPNGLQGWVNASYLQSAAAFFALPLWTG